ncbi:MAG: hypothetical protein LBG71_00715 [Clostridiales Family XIII bacterium]|jgi:hypothetical protein|nr:hypothetical protein [Clostridiales Family XIII bacterium]
MNKKEMHTMKVKEKKTDAYKKMLAFLLTVSLLVTCASLVYGEGHETLNTSQPQENVTFDPYDPLDAADGGAAGDASGAAGGGAPSGQEASGGDGADVITIEAGGDGTDLADPDHGPADGNGGADGGSASGGLTGPEAAAQGGVTDPDAPNQGASEIPVSIPGAVESPDGSILAVPELNMGRPPTEGGIYFAPELEPETGGGPAPSAPIDGAIEIEAGTAEAIALYGLNDVVSHDNGVTVIDLNKIINSGDWSFSENGGEIKYTPKTSWVQTSILSGYTARYGDSTGAVINLEGWCHAKRLGFPWSLTGPGRPNS